MLIVFSGADPIQVRKRAYASVEKCEAGGASLTRLEGEEISKEVLAVHARAQGLFGGEEVCVLDMPSESAEGIGSLKDVLPALKESAHTFIMIEGKLLAADAKLLKKYANEFFELKEEKQSTFNIFSLADALLRKDKKMLWLGYMRAQRSGLSGEEVIGTLLWQIKNMRLASMAHDAAEVGLKPFVYSKAKGGLKKYSGEDLTKHAGALLTIYHDGHAGLLDIDESLECWMLAL